MTVIYNDQWNKCSSLYPFIIQLVSEGMFDQNTHCIVMIKRCVKCSKKSKTLDTKSCFCCQILPDWLTFSPNCHTQSILDTKVFWSFLIFSLCGRIWSSKSIFLVWGSPWTDRRKNDQKHLPFRICRCTSWARLGRTLIFFCR